jgi:hypothetical protein
MFAVAFPLTPLLAFINNFFEARVDLTKLGQCRRPRLVLRSTIGAWYTCLEFVSFVAVLTNCYLLAMVSTHLDVLAPSVFHIHLDTEYGRLLAMLALEHLLLAVKVVMMNVIDNVPRHIQEKQARKRIQAKQQAIQERIIKYTQQKSDEYLESDPKRNTDDDNVNEDEAKTLQRLDNKLRSPFSFNPLSMAALIGTPMLLESCNLSPYIYLPLSVLFLSYFQSMKDRIDRKAAIGIISDPKLIQFMKKEMPSWISDSEFQRMEWFNSILQKMWPQITLAVEALVTEKVQPILEKSKPSVLTELKLSRCSLGSIAPKIIGIRFINSSESDVRLDIELRWAGDPLITLKASTIALPSLIVELADLNFSAVVRVELLELIHYMPCFTALSITCMKKPFVDFSLKVAGLDIMNIGAGDYNIMGLVRSTIHNALSSTLLYPERIIVQMDKGTSIDKVKLGNPVAVLSVMVEKATNVKSANMLMGSDPYVEMRSVNQVHRTATKYTTLNPVWQERFDIMVLDLASQMVDLDVIDSDMAGMEMSLGKAVINISQLKPMIETPKILSLIGGDKGQLHITCTLVPLYSSEKKYTEKRGELDVSALANEDDILYDLSPEELTDDSLRNDKLFDTTEYEDAEENHTRRNSLDLRKEPSAPVDGKVKVTNTILNKRTEMMRSIHELKPRIIITETTSGVLTVTTIKARSLNAPSSMTSWWDSNFRPFLMFSAGGNTQVTKAQKNTTSPQYSETLRFVIKDIRDEGLLVKAMGQNKYTSHSVLGQITVRLIESGVLKKEIEQEYALEGEDGALGSYVSFRMRWASSESSSPKAVAR